MKKRILNPELLLEKAQELLAGCSLEEAKALQAGLEEPWAEMQRKEAELIEALKDVFRRAGAREEQFTWGTFTNVPLSPLAELQALRICRKRDKLNWDSLPLLSLAAATNERIAELEGA